MDKIRANRQYSFGELRELQWRYHDGKFIGPMQPLDDPILVAGLLFVPFNSHSTRKITTSPYCYGGLPYVNIAFHHNFADSDYRKVPTTQVVRKLLLDGDYVEGTPHWGYTHMDELRLSQRGKQAVVTEWFRGSADVMAYLAAGAPTDAIPLPPW